jgi:putative PIN family toxin of toxin-antitoxin system
MKIVFDTNVLISAFIATGPSKDIFEYAVENHEVIISPYILKELKEKLTRKLEFSYKEYQEIEEILTLTDSIRIISGKVDGVQEFSDRKDIPILNLCIFVQADLLITGDKHLRKLGKIKSTRVISPSEFWDIERVNSE